MKNQTKWMSYEDMLKRDQEQKAKKKATPKKKVNPKKRDS